MTVDSTELPLTDPSINKTSNTFERDVTPETSCLRLVIRHDIREAGESRWAPWWLLFATRLTSGLGFVALGVFNLLFISSRIAEYILCGFAAISYLSLALCTWLNWYGVTLWGERNHKLPTAAVFVHSITAALSLFLISDFAHIVSTGRFDSNQLVLLIPAAVYLIDVLVMQTRIRLRFRYAFFFGVVSVLYFLVVLAYLLATCPSCTRVDAWVISYNVVFPLTAALFAVALTRIPWTFSKPQQ